MAFIKLSQALEGYSEDLLDRAADELSQVSRSDDGDNEIHHLAGGRIVVYRDPDTGGYVMRSAYD